MFKRLMIGVLTAGLMTLLFGCNTTNTGPETGFSNVRPEKAPTARNLEPGDGVELSVEVDGNMEVSQHRAELNEDGIVTLPLVGDVKVAGMKLATARKTIAKVYAEYYVNPPVVMLSFISADATGEWGFITVLGWVNDPGRVPLQSQNGINLSAAIQLAGGFAPSAKQNDVKVTRTDAQGRKQKTSVDFKQIGESGKTEADILLIDGDLIYVPQRIF